MLRPYQLCALLDVWILQTEGTKQSRCVRLSAYLFMCSNRFAIVAPVCNNHYNVPTQSQQCLG